ncbi:Leucine rich repeat-containing protein [Butyrivibrio sp. ob235]|uniref:leucine-rich repeat domain-containing protein n=1 Tax=unclassified Butyrivibrio TaxID=2639466 RepID=UPI0003B5E148|nr:MULTISPECIES: leucine-rich repeat domain-containing protein [unclassified Butyrivibrio]SEL31029.1 Leucine rich repeat-containing protein [Butyrivibrio sp. ob235]
MKKVTKYLYLLAFVVGLCASVKLSASAEGRMNVGEVYNSPYLQYVIIKQASEKDGYKHTPGQAIIKGFNPQFYKKTKACALGNGYYGYVETVSAVGRISVPRTQETFDVVGFAPGAFKNCKKLLYVNVKDFGSFFYPEGRQEFDIPDNCFAGCTGLKSVIWGESNSPYNTKTKIGKNAFKGCKSMQSFRVNASLTSIGSSAFMNCKSLKNFYVFTGDTDNEQSTVGKKAFKGVKKITVTYNVDNGYNPKSLAKKIKKAGAKKVYYVANNLKRKLK